MTRQKRFFLKTLVAASALWIAQANAAVIDVLWVAGNSSYNANIQDLAVDAPSYDPFGDGANTWNLTLWDYSTNPNPDFTQYDVLVAGSYLTGSFNMGGNPNGLLDINNKAAIEAARGTRTFLSGQDADWHDLNNRPNQPDGPEGFMINAVNWAASGVDLGIVSMVDNIGGGGWWFDPNSFLRDELLLGTVQYAGDNSVFIGAGQDLFPINEGLTSGGLSNWNTSSHVFFTGIPGYAAINFEGPGSTGRPITIVTAGEEGGGTGGPGGGGSGSVPVPSSLVLLGLGLVGIGYRRWKQQGFAS